MRASVFLLAVLGLAGAVQAAECPRPLEDRRGELAALLAAPSPPPFAARSSPPPPGAVVNDLGVRLPLREGGAAILANDWSRCRRGSPGCEPAERQEIIDYFPNLGLTLVAGWLPGREAALFRLVDDRNGTVTAIGGRPHPSPSGRRAAVVAGDSPLAWAGTEIWRLGGPVPTVEWEQDAPAPADYAFAGWRGDEVVLLAADRLGLGQTAPLAAALVCAGDAWHLIHDVGAPWLAALASPSGRRHALARSGAVIVWQDGEQVFAAPAVVTAFAGWADEDDARFVKPDGGSLWLRRGEVGWRLE